MTDLIVRAIDCPPSLKSAYEVLDDDEVVGRVYQKPARSFTGAWVGISTLEGGRTTYRLDTRKAAVEFIRREVLRLKEI